jgi:hypothetical protein
VNIIGGDLQSRRPLIAVLERAAGKPVRRGLEREDEEAKMSGAVQTGHRLPASRSSATATEDPDNALPAAGENRAIAAMK